MTDRHIAYEPLSEINGAERNPKRHDAAGIRGSITRFGVGELPLLDERTGRLVAGHGRLAQLQAMRDEGQSPPDGVHVDKATGEWLVPVIRGWGSRSDAEAEAYLLASNKLTFNGGWDEATLAEALEELASADFELATIAGWGAADIDQLLGSSDPALLHDEVPATNATYAETPEEQAAREARAASQTPRFVAGLTEMILIYTEGDRAEVGRLVQSARSVLGAELRASDIVLRSMRLLAVVLDGRHDNAPVSLASLGKSAGLDAELTAA